MSVKHFALSSHMTDPKDPGMLHERRKHLFLCPLHYHNKKCLQYLHIYLHGSEFQMNISRHTYTHSYNVKTSHSCLMLQLLGNQSFSLKFHFYLLYFTLTIQMSRIQIEIHQRRGSALRKLCNDNVLILILSRRWILNTQTTFPSTKQHAKKSYMRK